MKTCVLSIRDRAVNAFNRPFFSPTTQSGIRAFQDGIGSNESIEKHPEDFDLYFIGEFDDEKGSILPVEPVCVARAQDFVKKSS